MNYSDFLRGEAGWAASAAMVVEFLRRLLKGDIVLRREFDAMSDSAKEAIEKADKLVDEANQSALKTIESQAKLIELHERRERGS